MLDLHQDKTSKFLKTMSRDLGVTMAILVVDDVNDVQHLVDLMTYLAQALATGETHALVGEGTFTLTRSDSPSPALLHDLVRLGEHEFCSDPHHRAGCSCVEDAANTDPRQLRLLDGDRHDGPVPYVPCPERGQHRVLTECWMCWSDVHRGAITEQQALRPSTDATPRP